ncbi:TrkA C-terminal domain-containing protein [Leptolyngbya sp. AN02str]
MVENKVSREPGLVSVNILTNSCHCGIALSQIVVPENCTVLGVLRGDQIILFNDDPIVQFGDYVLALALHPALLPALKVALKKTHRVCYSLNECTVGLSDKSDERQTKKPPFFSRNSRNSRLQENSWLTDKSQVTNR